MKCEIKSDKALILLISSFFSVVWVQSWASGRHFSRYNDYWHTLFSVTWLLTHSQSLSHTKIKPTWQFLFCLLIPVHDLSERWTQVHTNPSSSEPQGRPPGRSPGVLTWKIFIHRDETWIIFTDYQLHLGNINKGSQKLLSHEYAVNKTDFSFILYRCGKCFDKYCTMC